MKLKLFLYLFIIFLLQKSDVYGQTNRNHLLVIIDSNSVPIQFATIQVYNLDNNSLIFSDITNEKGHLVFNKADSIKQKIVISHINYILKEIMIDGGEQTIITLQKKKEVLEELTVEKSNKVFERTNDRLVINVKNSSIYSSQTNINQLIANLPGILHLNNLITYRGNKRVQFAINGKSIQLPESAQYEYLQSINIQSVQKIELIEQPGASFETNGDVVVNIITNQTKSIGLKSTIQSSNGTAYSYNTFLPSSNNGISIQYGNQKLFASIGYQYNYMETFSNIGEKIDFLNNQQFHQNIDYFDRGENIHNPTFQLQYSLSKKSEMGASVNLSFKKKNTFLENDMFVATGKNIDSTIETISKESNISNQKAYNFYYKLKIDSNQHFNYIIDYIDNKKDFTIHSSNQFRLNTAYRNEVLDGKSMNEIYLVAQQIDYSNNISKNAKLEIGVKVGFAHSKNWVLYHEILSNQLINENLFDYKENTFSAFFVYNQVINTWNFNIGARYQSRTFRTDQSHDQNIKKEFKNIFPTITISKNFTSKNKLSLLYQKRIVNPIYSNLSPYEYYVNPFTTLRGNEFLKPSITNKIDLSFEFKSGVRLKSSNYKSKNFITTAQIQDTENFKQVLMNANIGDLYSSSLEFSYPFMVNQSYMGYIGTGFEYQHYKETGTNKFGYQSNKKLVYYLYTQQEISIPRVFNIEINGNVISPSPQGQFEINTIFYMNVGISKKLLNNKLDAQLLLNDLLKSLKYDGWVYGNQWISQYVNAKSSRQVILSLKYQLINKGKLKSGKATWITNEEKNRLPK